MNPTDLPELSKPTISRKKNGKTKIYRNQHLRKTPQKLTTIKFLARARSQVAIYTVFHAESESAVRNLRKLQENQHFEKT